MSTLLRKPLTKPAATQTASKPLIKKSEVETVNTTPTNPAARGFAIAKKINKEADERKEQLSHRPWDFYIGRTRYGQEHTVICLDEPYFMWAHEIKDPTKNMSVKNRIRCIENDVAETERNLSHECPLCKFESETVTKAKFFMVMTVLDVTDYGVDSNGNKIKPNRKLLVVSANKMSKWERIQNRVGNFKGRAITLIRDNDKEARTGETVELKGEKVFNKAELLKLFCNNEEKLLTQTDYLKAFPLQDENKLREQFGIPKTFVAGEKRTQPTTVEDEEVLTDDDENPWN
jgi:hypothetical protein